MSKNPITLTINHYHKLSHLTFFVVLEHLKYDTCICMLHILVIKNKVKMEIMVWAILKVTYSCPVFLGPQATFNHSYI
jgi:hypothetical protein